MKYSKPTLEELGMLAELTHGQNGSTLDGGGTYTQSGGGNNEDDPTDQNP